MQRRTFQWMFLLVVFTTVSIAALSVQAQTAAPRSPANIVLIIGNSPVYNTPNGTPIARFEVRVCQTFFLGATSPDGQFVQLQGLGNGWVPISVISDVAENYGQRGGAPVNSGCPGLSSATTSTPIAGQRCDPINIGNKYTCACPHDYGNNPNAFGDSS